MIIDYKEIDLFGEPLMSWGVVKTPFRISNPMPNEACFAYILEGESIIHSENQDISAFKNEAVLMKCGQYFGKMLSDRDDGKYSAVTVHFSPQVLKKAYNNEIPDFLKNPRKTFHSNMVKVGASVMLKKYIEGLLFYFENPQLATEEILVLKLKEIILLLLQTESSPQIIEILTNLFSERTYSFKEVVEAHIFSTMSISELAGLTNNSLSSFKREFNKIYKDTPANYIINKRVEKSAEKLLVSDENISNIAYQCGFKTNAHYSRLFRNKFGMPPSEYRVRFSKN